MSSLNKAMLIGNLGADPELKSTGNGNSVTTLSVATNERWKDKDGNEQDRTEWHKVVVWGKTAEHCCNYLAKGSTVYVEGRIQTRKYEDKDGQTRYSTEVVADKVTFLSTGSKGESGSRSDSPGQAPKPMSSPPPKASAKPKSAPAADFADDDIPF
jgi:single-strand DNA-binding protein